MKIERITIFAFALAIIFLIVGLSACDQIGQLLVPATPQIGRNLHRRCFTCHRTTRLYIWSTNRYWF